MVFGREEAFVIESKDTHLRDRSIESTVRIEIVSGNRVITGTGVIIDDNSVLTAAHVLTPLVDDRHATARIIFSESLDRPPIQVNAENLSIQSLSDPDPDRDGRTTLNMISGDLAVLGSPAFDFQMILQPTLSVANPIAELQHSGVLSTPTRDFVLHEVTTGLSLSERDGLLRITHPIEPGDSGSGLFSSNASDFELVGVVSTAEYGAGLTENTIDQVLRFAIQDDQWPLRTTAIEQPITAPQMLYQAGIAMIYGKPVSLIQKPMTISGSVSDVAEALLAFGPLYIDTLNEKNALVERMLDYLDIQFNSPQEQLSAEQWALGLPTEELVLLGVQHLDTILSNT